MERERERESERERERERQEERDGGGGERCNACVAVQFPRGPVLPVLCAPTLNVRYGPLKSWIPVLLRYVVFCVRLRRVSLAWGSEMSV